MRDFRAALFLLLFLVIACGEDKKKEEPSPTTTTAPVVTCISNCADSGACSNHGGVNCSAGPDTDGSVICNDGWKDSTITYRCR